MFTFLKKDKETTKTKSQLVAVQNGTLVKVENLPDPMFAEKILGDGFAILPNNDGIVVSPADATVEEVQDTLHAYCLHTNDGLDILVHIGINTVSLNGEGFKSKVKKGQNIKAGDTLAIVDLNLIESKGLPTYTIVLITNVDKLKNFTICNNKEVKSGETIVINYNI
ncbi:MAG: PTS glucose transporter subunit IIA [Ruminococcus sp.]|nr:PTS glucose transporter subunit IIA [Ruminococcus sp.]